jgi:hypothetical protein
VLVENQRLYRIGICAMKKVGQVSAITHIRFQTDVDVLSQGIWVDFKGNREVIHGYLCDRVGAHEQGAYLSKNQGENLTES